MKDSTSSGKNSTPFLPTSLQGWLTLLTTIGLPVGTIVAFLVRYWKETEGEVLVNTRLLLMLGVAIVLGLGVLLWIARRRTRQLKSYQESGAKVVKVALERPEEEILRYFADNDGLHVLAGTVMSHLKLPTVRFQYHWNQLFGVYRLLDHVGTTKFGEGLYMLSHKGREYVIRNGLDVR